VKIEVEADETTYGLSGIFIFLWLLSTIVYLLKQFMICS
jgi:hypothetical protein